MSQTGSEVENLPLDEEADKNQSIEGEGHEDYQESIGPTTYRTEDFISRPFFSEACDVEENILELDHSYGYDCKKPYNLVPMDEKLIIFASGNLIHFFNVETGDVWFRRSAQGGGIGHITRNPNPDYSHIAVGEKGTDPLIIIYEWPSMAIVCVLEGGTTKTYTHLNYSPGGELLVSQGGEPDYLITVWNWPKSTIMLRSKSYYNDVLRVMFSPEVPGQLTSCGLSHIKFWKMVETFTGLKLQGELGRFGKTEYTDIVGIYPMADEKVISGCYWGNILVWEEGLIKLEVCRKNRKRCHDGPIVQFDYKNGELWTVSMDGRVRLWYYDTIDQADPPEEDRMVQMEPTYDFYTPGAEFMCIVKQSEDPDDTFYFAQDGRGGIWKIDLTIETDAKPSERLLKSHAGIAKDLSVCPWGPYFITIGIGGRLHLYHYLERCLLFVYLFPAKGSCMIWVPMHVDPSGEVIICACDDGTLRVGVYKIDKKDGANSKLHIIQIIKPHNKPIGKISMNEAGTLLVTAGEDRTVFVFKIQTMRRKYLKLVKIGYIKTPGIPTCFLWHNHELKNILTVGCNNGYFITAEIPSEPVSYTTISYLLKTDSAIVQKFTSCKSQILREIRLKEIEAIKAEKRLIKTKELEKIKKDNRGIDIDEELFLADSESEEELPPLYIPTIPNEIIWMKHTGDDTIWLSMGGYDAGYIYEYKIGQTDELPHRTILIEGAGDLEIRNYCYSKNNEYLIFAMQDGSLRVNRVNPSNWRDLSNYWQLTMHDNQNGNIPGMGFTYDNTFFLTCGYDGNVFAFRFNPDGDLYDTESIREREIPPNLELIPLEDKACYHLMTLEETIVKAEDDRINRVAEQNKQKYLKELAKLREEYEVLLERNRKLPDSQKISVEEMGIDDRITKDLDDRLKAKIDLVNRELEFKIEKSAILMKKLKAHFLETMGLFPLKVKAIRVDQSCECIKQPKLEDNFYEMLKEVDERIAKAELKGRRPERPRIEQAKSVSLPKSAPKLEHFLLGLSPEVIEKRLGVKINRLLNKYRERRRKREEYNEELEALNAVKPNEMTIDPEDEKIIKEAEDTIGDLKLKTSEDYRVPPEFRESTLKKFKSILLSREKQYNLARDFNNLVYELRKKKQMLHEYLKEQTEMLDQIHDEIEEDEKLYGPEVFEFGEDDFPEREYEVKFKTKDEVEENIPIVEKPSPDLLEFEILQPRSHVEAIEEETLTEWEIEITNERHKRKVSEQKQIIKMMNNAIKDFDQEVEKAHHERVNVSVDHSLITLHLLTENQELMILKECETKEDALSEKVHEKMNELLDLQDITTDLNMSIDTCKKEVEKLQEKEKEIHRSFLSSAQENKFFDFLRRIFKKKYRPPRIIKGDESESESSSSSSDESEDEDDAASIDSKDFQLVRLDENVCPKGCDQDLYNLTFSLRSQRHAIEQELRSLSVKIENLRKDCDGYNKKIKVLTGALNICNEDLESFLREKQFKLNEVYCTIILNLEQLQHFDEEDGDFVPVNEMLVVTEDIMSQLNSRIEELDRDTAIQKSQHKISITHLTRMKHDINFMTSEIDSWKKKIDELMKNKFSGKVNIDELEECMLKKLIHDLKLSITDYDNLEEEEKKYWYKILVEKQKLLQETYVIHTENTELFRMLQTERDGLIKTHNEQQAFQLEMDQLLEEAEKAKEGLKTLRNIIKDQRIEIETLKREIKILKTKGLTLREDKKEPDTKQEFAVDEDDLSQMECWDELDDYMYTENYAQEYWAQKQQKDLLKTRQEVILSIIEELLANIKIKIEHNAVAKILKKAVSDELNKCDVQEILKDILEAIPEELNDDQQSLIELTVEKLNSLEDFPQSARNLDEMNGTLKKIIDQVSEEDVTDEVYIKKMINALIENLPLSFILSDQAIHRISSKIGERFSLSGSGNIEIIREVVNFDSFEARAILHEIIDHIINEDTEEYVVDYDDELQEESENRDEDYIVSEDEGSSSPQTE